MTETASSPPQERPLTFGRVVFLIFAYLWAFVLLGCVAAGLLTFIVYDHVIEEGRPGTKVEVIIPAGATGADVGKILKERGLVAHEAFFRLALKLDESGGAIRHGIYDLHQGLSASQLLARIQEGPARHEHMNQIRITVPEGLSLAQAATLFDESEAFLDAAKNPALLARLGLEVESLEGFLLPETYFFDETPTAEEIVARMVAQFEAAYNRLSAAIPGAADYDPLVIVTVASLIEEEARVDEERAQVASVIYNRIDRGMPLQMDSTLQYALGKYGQRMLYEDREVDSPYNTYLHAGLPPGPISCAGVASLRAALQPADTDYLYFVSNADGKSHTFSRTMKEHEAAVARYRREMREQRR